MPPRGRTRAQAKAAPKKEQVQEEEDPTTTLTKRLFVERSRISKHLVCSICMDVFTDPVMPPACQHTFCRKCLTSLVENYRTANAPCPFCRKNFKLSTVKTNLLASAMISELEIYCSNRNKNCPWKGEM